MILKQSKSILILAFVIVFLILMSSTSVMSLSSKEVTTIYFSDASHTKIVGVVSKPCWGTVSKWGIITKYKDQIEWDCDINDDDEGCGPHQFPCP